MKPNVFFCAFVLVLNWGCSKDPDLVPKTDYRDKFIGTYDMTFSMYSSNSYLLQTPKRYTGVAIVKVFVRKAGLRDKKSFTPMQLTHPPEINGLVIEGIPYLSTGNGGMFQYSWYRIVHDHGDGSLSGYNDLIFKGDSLYIADYYGSCYGKYYTCRTNGQGKKIR